jgi:hypothetical protein
MKYKFKITSIKTTYFFNEIIAISEIYIMEAFNKRTMGI